MKSIVPFITLCAFLVLGMYSMGWRAINLDPVPKAHWPVSAFVFAEWGGHR